MYIDEGTINLYKTKQKQNKRHQTLLFRTNFIANIKGPPQVIPQ